MTTSPEQPLESSAIFCPQCGFDLSGLPDEHRCPECGFGYQREAIVELATEHMYTKAGLHRQIVLGAIAMCVVCALTFVVHIESAIGYRSNRALPIRAIGIAAIIVADFWRQLKAGRPDYDGDWRLRSAAAGWALLFFVATMFPHFLSGMMLALVGSLIAMRIFYRPPYPFLDASALADARDEFDRWKQRTHWAAPMAVAAALLMTVVV